MSVPAPSLLSPLLSARDLRVGAAVDGLAFVARGPRLLVLGAPRSLFGAVAGVVGVDRGELLVSGVAADAALGAGLVAGAPLDPPMPPAWTVARWIAWSARLSGMRAGEARVAATRAIAALRMTTVASSRLGGSPPHVRRAAVIAGALATGARTIVIEDFTPGLPDAAARSLSDLVVQALATLSWVLFAARAPLDAPLVAAASEAVVLAGGQLASQGRPAELAARAATYAVRLAANDGASDPRVALRQFVDAATARGAKPTVDETAAASGVCTVDLGTAMRASELLGIAASAGAVVVELRPIARAFA